MRIQRKEELDQHIKAVNTELRKQNPDISDSESAAEVNGHEEEWQGIEEAVPEVAQDEEYVDEDKYTTVTVEAMGEPGEESENDSKTVDAERKGQAANGEPQAPKKRIWSKENKVKPKKKKFRYDNKAERSATRQKQKSKNHAAMMRRKGK